MWFPLGHVSAMADLLQIASDEIEEMRGGDYTRGRLSSKHGTSEGLA